MNSDSAASLPLVSVIIPSYNHGRYLSQAISSVLSQDYPNIQIIVVDDGSTDNTKSVAGGFEKVRYQYQQNQGLSAARNTGINFATGDYIVLLDADDWLLPGALSTNVSYLEEDGQLAFVSGAHTKVLEYSGRSEEKIVVHNEDHYQWMLKGNYIAMHAAAMFRRSVFDEFRYDTELKALEDYDLYLKIMRRYPVKHHGKPVAAYRIHEANMSGNIPLMLASALKVLGANKALLKNKAEELAWNAGVKYWKNYYGGSLYANLAGKKLSEALERPADVQTLFRLNKILFIKLIIKQMTLPVKKQVKKTLNAMGILRHSPKLHKINFGDLDRTTPFSTEFGYDRGGPVDRYYIESFLEKNKHDIKGDVLEIGDNEYTLKFGEDRIKKSHILHVDDKNEKATYVGDLCDVPQIADNSFDCIVLTQTLHLIYDYKKAIATCYRILKPGGVLLMTVPGISHIDFSDWKHLWLWSFTDSVIQKILGESFAEEKIATETFGNVFIATAFLYGVGLPEVEKRKLDDHDPHYQVIIASRAVK